MNYKLIVAYCKNNGIGINNNLPWNIKSDLIQFSKLTKGSGNNAIVVGRNTWLSIPNTPLKKRDNLLLSKTISIDERDANGELIKSFSDIKTLKEFCRDKYDTVWIIGGVGVYDAFLKDDCLSELHITYIDKDFDCDVFFPNIEDTWVCVKQEVHELVTKDISLQNGMVFNKIYIPKILPK